MTFAHFFTLLAAMAVALPAAALEPEELGGLRIYSLFAEGCAAIAYAPVPTYQTPGGLRAGRLILDHPEYAKESQKACSFRPKALLQLEGSTVTRDVLTLEVGYEEPGLSIFAVQQGQGTAWYQGKSEQSTFWVKASDIRGAQYLSFENDLVFGVTLLTESCDARGRCQPLPAKVQELAVEAGNYNVETCYGNAYVFSDYDAKVVTLPTGRKAYKVQLAPSLVAKFGKELPLELLVPTYDFRGKWTGFHYSRGC